MIPLSPGCPQAPDAKALQAHLLCERGIPAESLLGENEVPRVHKYDEFIPAELLRKAFVADCLDVTEVHKKMLSLC